VREAVEEISRAGIAPLFQHQRVAAWTAAIVPLAIRSDTRTFTYAAHPNRYCQSGGELDTER
jgi:hypothetical protein